VAKIPTGIWSRGTKLVGMASKVAMNEISSRVKNWEDEKSKVASKIELAHNIVKTMSELKGASMKVGQLLSMDLGDYLPPEVIKILENLHQNSTFMPYEVIEDILKTELVDKFSDLTDISHTPIAAASIGQVHTARFQNKEIVIKIQYPGVADSIPSDLKLLKLLLRNLTFIQGKDLDLDPFFNEVEEVLIKETDYLHEQLMHKQYKESFKDSIYLIPEVYPEVSTDKIIIMDRIEGKSFNEWIKTSLYGERMKLAKNLMNLYLEEFFDYGLVQTDPNPGNFLITAENQMALLDFGAVKQYDRAFINGYRSILNAAHEKNQLILLSESERLGFIDPRESEEIKQIYLEMVELLAAPFRQDTPFDFSDKKFFEESQKLSWDLVKKCKYSPPPKDLLFLHRKLGGVFFLIKKLDAKIILKDYWHKVAN
jgi:aarF domain-containing kinase